MEVVKLIYFPTHKQIEEILRIAIKMPSVSIKYVSQETNINTSVLYNWSCGAKGLGVNKMDTIINWLNDCRPDVLPAAIREYGKKVNCYEL